MEAIVKEKTNSDKTMNKIRYSCVVVDTPEDLMAVSLVRARAYAAKGKISKKYDTLTDRFDSQSLILGVKVDGHLVGSARIIIYSKTDVSETEEFVTLPNEFSNKESWVEVSRLCVDPSHQDTKAFKVLIQNIFKVCLRLGKMTILAGASGRLIDLYESIGAEKLNVTYKHAALNNTDHELLKFDLIAIATGKRKLHRKFEQWRQEALTTLVDTNKAQEIQS